MSSLLSIKTGGCPEDCGYCPQAARYHTDIDTHKIMDVEQVLEQAKNAKANGSSRLCMGAAWREVRDNKDFDKVVEMVQGVNDMDMEVCCTLGMLTEDQAKRLKCRFVCIQPQFRFFQGVLQGCDFYPRIRAEIRYH